MIKQDRINMEALNEQIENYKRTMSTLKEALQEMQSRFGKTEQQKSQLHDKVVGVVSTYDTLIELIVVMEIVFLWMRWLPWQLFWVTFDQNMCGCGQTIGMVIIMINPLAVGGVINCLNCVVLCRTTEAQLVSGKYADDKETRDRSLEVRARHFNEDLSR